MGGGNFPMLRGSGGTAHYGWRLIGRIQYIATEGKYSPLPPAGIMTLRVELLSIF